MTATSTPDSDRRDGGRRWRRAKARNGLRLQLQRAWGLYLGILFAVALAIAAVAPQLLAPYAPTASDFAAALRGPSAAHWFGTDEQGRDLFSRVIFGAAPSLLIGIGAAAVGIGIALALGAVAALAPRPIAAIVDRFIEVMFSFPALLLALLLIAIAGPSALTEVFAVGIGTAPGYARMVRGQILGARRSPYVEAAVALGHSSGRIIRAHILPNAVRPLVAIFALSIGQSIVWASSLSFLGLGVAPPASEWGALLDAGRSYIVQAPWLLVIPGLVIVAVALAATTIGRHLQLRLEKGERP